MRFAGCEQVDHEQGKMVKEYKTFMCTVCGFIYDEELGWPEDGIAPGTRWADVPDTWVCPECGATKEDFEMEEI
jgi:rubredoxin